MTTLKLVMANGATFTTPAPGTVEECRDGVARAIESGAPIAWAKAETGEITMVNTRYVTHAQVLP